MGEINAKGSCRLKGSHLDVDLLWRTIVTYFVRFTTSRILYLLIMHNIVLNGLQIQYEFKSVGFSTETFIVNLFNF